MSLNPVLGSFFCLIAWISLAHAIQGHTSNCCLRLSKTRVPVENIRNYTIQSSGLCSIGAVVFLTKKGKTICSDPGSLWTKKAMLKVDEEMRSLEEARRSQQVVTSDITPAPLTEAEVGLSSDPKEERVTKATLRVEEVTQRQLEERSSEQVTTSDITPAARTEAEVTRGVTSDPKSEWATKATLKMEEVTQRPQEERQSEQMTTSDITPAARTEAEVARGVTSDPKKEHSTEAVLKVEEVTKSQQEARQSEQVTTGDVMPTAVKMVRRKRPWRKARRVKRRQKCKNVRKQQMSRF